MSMGLKRTTLYRVQFQLYCFSSCFHTIDRSYDSSSLWCTQVSSRVVMLRKPFPPTSCWFSRSAHVRILCWSWSSAALCDPSGAQFVLSGVLSALKVSSLDLTQFVSCSALILKNRLIHCLFVRRGRHPDLDRFFYTHRQTVLTPIQLSQ